MILCEQIFTIVTAFCTWEYLDWNVGSLEVKSVTRFDYMSCLLEPKPWNVFWSNFQHLSRKRQVFILVKVLIEEKGGGGIIPVLVWYRLFTYHPDLGIRYFTFSYQPGSRTGFKTNFWLVCDKIIPICQSHMETWDIFQVFKLLQNCNKVSISSGP